MACIERITLRPRVATQPLPTDADDPAIWVNPTQPERSLIFGTNKARAPEGAIGVYNLHGRLIQLIRQIDQPNNIDVAYGFRLGSQRIDIAVATERYASRLRIFRIDPHRLRLEDITDLSNTRVFPDSEGEAAMPMGVALYTHPISREVFAIVSRKTGPTEGYLHQYQLVGRNGRVGVQFVRAFGRFSGKEEIEAIAVDSPLGYVYYADETIGIRKYYADPNRPHAAQEVATFATHFQGDHEGIAVYAPKESSGWLICVEQLPDNSLWYLYPRFGRQQEPIAVVESGADETDGLDACAQPMGRAFPAGVIVAMNSKGRNFLLYSAADLRAKLR